MATNSNNSSSNILNSNMIKLSKFLSNGFLAGNSHWFSGNYHKVECCLVRVLECIRHFGFSYLVEKQFVQSWALKVSGSSFHTMAIILSRYSYLHWQNVVSAFLFPELERL